MKGHVTKLKTPSLYLSTRFLLLNGNEGHKQSFVAEHTAGDSRLGVTVRKKQIDHDKVNTAALALPPLNANDPVSELPVWALSHEDIF